jgi:hypothetical protein
VNEELPRLPEDAESPPLSDGDLAHLWAARWEPAYARALWARINAQRTAQALLRRPRTAQSAREIPAPRSTSSGTERTAGAGIPSQEVAEDR